MSDPRRPDELDARLDEALDALAAGAPPAEHDDEEYGALVDIARIARRLREPENPDESMAREMVDFLARELAEGSPNGRVSPAEFSRYRSQRRRRHWWIAAVAALLRMLGAGMIAGIIAGVLAFGAGGRIAMRISGMLYEREHPDSTIITESSGQAVGVITLTGTIDLMMQGMFAGLVGGLFYVVLRRWLPEAPRSRAIVAGGLMLLIAGTLAVDADNADFARIGIPWLNIVMFGGIVLLFGFLVSVITERLISRKPTSDRSAASAVFDAGLYLAGAVGLMIVSLLILALSIMAISELGWALTRGQGIIVILSFLVVILTVTLLPILAVFSSTSVAGSGNSDAAGISPSRQAKLVRSGRWVLALAATSGLVLLAQAVFTILTN